jgi:hypothetical protein
MLTATAGTWGSAVESPISSRWDESLLNCELHDVSIESNDMRRAWQEMGKKYLLRCNLYADVISDSDSTMFSFKKKITTGKELIQAFLGSYPEYTYTQSPETGIIWIHRKIIPFKSVLPQKVSVKAAALQIPMYQGIFEPLIRLLASGYPIGISYPLGMSPEKYNSSSVFNYYVDLPAGEYTFRDILDFCCVQNPNQVFAFTPYVTRNHEVLIEGTPLDLSYRNPVAPPRALAIAYWEMEVGKTTDDVPSYGEIVSALADSSPQIRTKALRFLELTAQNYDRNDLLRTKTVDDLRKADWAMLGLKSITFSPDSNFEMFTDEHVPWVIQSISNMVEIDPGLALLVSMELAREKKEPSFIDCVAGHKFTEAEIAVIKPDVYRIARVSKLVRDKLVQMTFDAPELSPASLRDLENTNLFSLVPREKN